MFFLRGLTIFCSLLLAVRPGLGADFNESDDQNSFIAAAPAQDCPKPFIGTSGPDEFQIAWNPFATIGSNLPLVDNNKILNHDNQALAAALPPRIHCWNQLKNWHLERRKFEYRWKNSMWWDFVVEGEVVWLAGATDLRDKGRYIGFVTVKINKVSRGLIRRVDISARAPQEMIVNIGTDKNPVSSVTIMLRSSVRNATNTEIGNWVISVDGMGNISDVSKESGQN